MLCNTLRFVDYIDKVIIYERGGSFALELFEKIIYLIRRIQPAEPIA